MLRFHNVLLMIGGCVLLALALLYSKLPEPMPADSVSARLLDSTIYQVGEVAHQLIDERRQTAANGAFSGLGYRQLDTTIWYPMVEEAAVAPGRHPLLVFSHGFSSSKEEGAYLARFLARQGYIVAAVDFPLTRVGAPGGATANDVMSQPGDISFVINRLLDWNQRSHSPWHQRIDHHRIGALGVSLGGLTSALLLYHPELRDERIRFAVAVAAPLATMDASWLEDVRAPFMVIASGQDALVDYRRHAQQVVASFADMLLVTLNDASHIGFSGFSRYLRWLPDPDLVTCARVRSSLVQDSSLAWLLLADSGPGKPSSSAPLSAVCERKQNEMMNPLRQQWITALAVYNFVQQQFADSTAEVAFASRYLHEILPTEFVGSVSVDGRYASLADVTWPAVDDMH